MASSTKTITIDIPVIGETALGDLIYDCESTLAQFIPTFAASASLDVEVNANDVKDTVGALADLVGDKKLTDFVKKAKKLVPEGKMGLRVALMPQLNVQPCPQDATRASVITCVIPIRDVSAAYHQPSYIRQRWRMVDAALVKLFPEQRSVTSQQGQTLPIWEIFPELPKNLEQAESHVPAQISRLLGDLFHNLEIDAIAEAEKHKPDERSAAAKRYFEKARKSLWGRLSRASGEVLDRDFGQHGLQTLRARFDAEGASFGEGLHQGITGHYTTFEHVSLEGGEQGVFQTIFLQMAKLDGYDVWVRSADTPDQKAKKFIADPGEPNGKRPLPEIRSWRVPVRTWAEAETWPSGKEGEPDLARPTHEAGEVRADYVAHLAALGAFHPQDADVIDAFRERLDPGCIEAADFNLSAARYRPASDVAEVHRSPTEIVHELRGHHQNILSALDRLLEKIGGV